MKVDASTIDSMHEGFVDLWNAQDVKGLSNSLAKEVTYMSNTLSDKMIVRGRDLVTEHWIEEGAPNMKDLEVQIVSSSAGPGLMYAAGTYEHDMMSGDSIVGPFSGQYTLIWTQGEDMKDWKTSHIHLRQTDSPRRRLKAKQSDEKMIE